MIGDLDRHTVAHSVVQVPDPDKPGTFFFVEIRAVTDEQRPWAVNLPDLLREALCAAVRAEKVVTPNPEAAS